MKWRKLRWRRSRGRGKKISVNEISVITDSVRTNPDTIQSKLTNSGTNKKKKNQIWEEITKDVNAAGQANRTVQEVKDKWKNLHSIAKKEFSSFNNEGKKTGGGPQPKPPSQSSEQIIEIFEDTPAFAGLRGFETGGDASFRFVNGRCHF